MVGKYDADNKTQASVKDALGALPFGTYTVEEIKCEANKAYEMVTFSVNISRDGYTLPSFEVDNGLPELPWISTTASDATNGDKTVFADYAATINDSVEYGNLTAGNTYTLSLTLIDPTTGNALEGGTATKEFTAKSATGSTEISCTLDLRGYKGTKVVVYEQLLSEGEVIATHEEIDSTTQSVL